MATAVVQINGATGSRSDLSVSTLVSLNDAGTGAVSRLWEFLSRPPGSAAILANPTTQTPTFTPDIVGSYRVRLTVNGSVTDIVIAAVRTDYLDIRIPATGEEDEFDELGNLTGWSASLHEAFLAIDDNVIHASSHSDGGADEITVQNLGSGVAALNTILLSDGTGGWSIGTRNTLDLAYDQGGSGSGRTITIDSGAVRLNASEGMALEIDGYITLEGIALPAAVSGKGSLFTQLLVDPSGIELRYMDDEGKVTYITEDGYMRLGPGYLPEISDPISRADAGFIYAKDVTGTSELFYMDSDGTATQITGGGSISGNTLDQSYNEGGAGAGRTITADSGAVEIDASGDMALSLDGYIALTEISDPANIANLGFIYVKDDSGDSELYYMDNSGNVIQLTRDGTIFGNTLDQAYNEGGAGAGRTIIADSGALVINASEDMALEIDGYITLEGIALPTAVSDKGSLFTQLLVDPSGIELRYMDDEGKVTYITEDGYMRLGPGYLPEMTDPINRADAGFIYAKDVTGTSELFYMDSDGTATQITGGGSIAGNTLDQSYDEGGAGAGRTIIADSGPVEIDASGDMALSLDGYLSLSEISTPSGLVNKGAVYVQDADGYSEFYYMDNYGNAIRLTQRGTLSGGIIEYSDEINPLTSAGTETSLSLTAVPLTQISKLSGYSLEMFLNGVQMRYVSLLGLDPMEWTYNSGLNRTEFVATGIPNSWHMAEYKTSLGAGATASGTLDAAYDYTGGGAGRVIAVDSGALTLNASGAEALSIDGYLGLETIIDPNPLIDKGILYTKTVDGYDELHYMDSAGSALRLSEDGYSYVTLLAPNGTAFKLAVDNTGSLITTPL